MQIESTNEAFCKIYIGKQKEAKSWAKVVVALKLAVMGCQVLGIIEALTTTINNMVYPNVDTSSEILIEEIPDKKCFSISHGFAQTFFASKKFRGTEQEFKEAFDSKVISQKKLDQFVQEQGALVERGKPGYVRRIALQFNF